MLDGIEMDVRRRSAERSEFPVASAQTYVMRGSALERALDVYHLILAPTYACNLRCSHCYLPDHSVELLPRDVALRLVDEWAEITRTERGAYRGIFHVKGGEPFVVPYLSSIVERVIEHRCLQFMMTTNGTVVGNKAERLLAAAQQGLEGHLTVVVSLDGVTAESHDFLRGAGQYERTIRFVRLLQREGIRTYLNCVLHQGNLNEIRDFLALAYEHSVAQVNFLPLVPKGFGKALRCHQAPPAEVQDLLLEVYREADEATRRLMAGSLPDIVEREARGELIAAAECVAGYRGLFYIKPDGSTFTCPNLEDAKFSVGNVKEQSLSVLHHKLKDLYAKLRRSAVNDRYICTGERIKYDGGADAQNVASLMAVQERSGRASASYTAVRSEVRSDRRAVAFCVSRNW